jgi:hypothetical protein
MERLRLLFRRKRPAPAAAPAALASLRIEGVNYVFGLDWRLLPPNRRLTRALALAREEGQAWCALSEMEDVVGFLAAPQWLRGHHYSACLHLAARSSQGGLELFAFVFAPDRHAVLALQESRPLPGFDYLGDAETARAMVEEFLAIQRGQPMRLVGNTDYLEGQEQVSPEDLFVEPVKSARLRSLRSWRALRRGAVFAAFAVAVALGGNKLLEHRRAQTLAQLESSPAHQQNLYQESLNAAWATVPPASAVVLGQWQALLAQLPLRVQGWRLARVDCDVAQCEAHWLREHGSYADFLARLPAGASGVDEAASDQELLGGKLVTRHQLAPPAGEGPQLRQGLPPLRQARRQLADHLQDLLLLGPAVPRIEAAQLFGGAQDPDLLVEPVFSGAWSLRHSLWVLPSLSLPGFARVQSLRVDLRVALASTQPLASPPPGDAPPQEQEASDSRPAEPFFELVGSYYAQK